MDIRFVPPELSRLDDASAELCACGIWSDERPVRGFAGLIDWRLAGRLSATLRSGFVTGQRGETLLIPGKPYLPFEKVLVLGLGSRAEFDDDGFRAGVLHLARALEGLHVRRAVIELPGRASQRVDPKAAITLTLDCVGESAEHDVWWLVEEPAAQKLIEERAADERRRTRTA
ncbi:MAG: M17 family peptidase N-terminal domain-containing protein [Polyangiaceae bacterium]